MLRISRWVGLLTNASPYALPPGAAQQQVNFILSQPGQITSRGGMVKASFRSRAGKALTGVIEQTFPITGGMGQPDRILVIDSTGEIGFVDGTTL
jgi:hypothetical protein